MEALLESSLIRRGYSLADIRSLTSEELMDHLAAGLAVEEEQDVGDSLGAFFQQGAMGVGMRGL